MYASTPPRAALRFIVSYASTLSTGGGRRIIMIRDVHRAYFYAKIHSEVHIELPKEDHDHGKGLLGGEIEVLSVWHA